MRSNCFLVTTKIAFVVAPLGAGSSVRTTSFHFDFFGVSLRDTVIPKKSGAAPNRNSLYSNASG